LGSVGYCLGLTALLNYDATEKQPRATKTDWIKISGERLQATYFEGFLSAFLFLTTAVSVMAGELSASPDSFAGIFSPEGKTLTGDWFGER
jgi:hypothetical protein